MFQQCLGWFTMLPVKQFPQKRLFRHISNHVFLNLSYRKYITYEDHLFAENNQNLMQSSNMQRKIEKKLFAFEIIATELVALNFLY